MSNKLKHNNTLDVFLLLTITGPLAVWAISGIIYTPLAHQVHFEPPAWMLFPWWVAGLLILEKFWNKTVGYNTLIICTGIALAGGLYV